ncbi:MAG: tRNA (cytidine(34)-2'-O)-methyltransferase [Oscillospiraceae bacterium]|jgi:tRNA (cytidine/uridine-2'-O-)-methyltransferase|nr:tRNA (cytidine(34)-2'-O)-methyltransferase [Oscillospiraceae bacterium]
MTLNIVLVEPQIPQNTGNVARTCAATGARLHLVGPMAFSIDDKKLKRAGLDYWHLLDITYYTNITEFFSKVSDGGIVGKSIKSTAITAPDTSAYEFYYFTTKAPHIYTEPEYKDNVYLFFGSETNGLDEALLYKNSGQCIRFPMLPGARSMNLSNAVAVGVFEVLRQWGFPKLQNYGKMA